MPLSTREFPFVPFTGVFLRSRLARGIICVRSLLDLTLRTRRHTESSAGGCARVRARPPPAAESEKNSVFWQTPKRSSLLKCGRPRGRKRRGGAAAAAAGPRAAARDHTMDRARRGDEHRSRCRHDHAHVHTDTRTHAYIRTRVAGAPRMPARVRTRAHARTHARTLHALHCTRSFGQNLKDTSRKKVQVYHVAP